MLPYYDIKTTEEPRVIITIERGELPKIPPSLRRNDFEIYKEGITGLCHMCWVKDPGHRPSIDIIASFINSHCFKGETCDVATNTDNDRSIGSGQNAIASLRCSPSLSITSPGELGGRTARVILNEYFNGLPRLKYEHGAMAIGSSNIPVQTVTCSIEGREYGLASVRGKKKEAEELAALRALERLRRENPFKIPALRYLPILMEHMSAHQGKFEWSPPAEPELEDNGKRIHTVTLRFNGAVLGVGAGPTRDDAQEDAAQNAAVVWRGGSTESS
ncbi:hypothetical protein M0805_007254 [Coniferiporia weirii]|nr:hypothetical protein M0805_007254 [Coniferiporia weirii]